MILRMMLVIIMMGTAHAAFGQQQPAMTMHRTQAGELDSSGWTAARSTEGGFAVRLPLRFNDFTVTDSDPASPTGKVFTVGAKSVEGVKITATRITYRKADGAATYFTKIGRGEGLQAKPQSIKTLTVLGRKAIDLQLSTGSAVSYARYVLLGSDVIVLIVEAPVAQRSLAEDLAPRFFGSLAVERK
jgi:hypothetical protein